MTQKVKVTQDIVYQYLTEHGVKLVRIAELMKLSEASVNVCFNHFPGTNGQPREFTRSSLRKLNEALNQMANMLRGCLLTFGSEQMFTNQRGKTYDPALVEPMKKIGEQIGRAHV